MDLVSFLNNCTLEELKERLLMLDQSMMELHDYGLFVVGDLSQITVIDDEITLQSFKNKVDYLNSGYDPNGDMNDIREMCAIGICAYNRFGSLNTSPMFIEYLKVKQNLEMYLQNKNIPSEIKDYYRAVLLDGKKEYMNSYFAKNNSNKGGNKANVMVKATAVGRALADRDAAYVNILLLPSILALLYLVFVIVYFIVR